MYPLCVCRQITHALDFMNDAQRMDMFNTEEAMLVLGTYLQYVNNVPYTQAQRNARKLHGRILGIRFLQETEVVR